MWPWRVHFASQQPGNDHKELRFPANSAEARTVPGWVYLPLACPLRASQCHVCVCIRRKGRGDAARRCHRTARHRGGELLCELLPLRKIVPGSDGPWPPIRGDAGDARPRIFRQRSDGSPRPAGLVSLRAAGALPEFLVYDTARRTRRVVESSIFRATADPPAVLLA
jgi:hypothetical protein